MTTKRIVNLKVQLKAATAEGRILARTKASLDRIVAKNTLEITRLENRLEDYMAKSKRQADTEN